MKASILAGTIANSFPELTQTRLPHGGYIFSRDGTTELGVHVLFSPLPVSALDDVRSQLDAVNKDLRKIFDGAYAEILLEMNGAHFFYPYIFLYGWPAPREVNRNDVGYYPFDLCWANFSERCLDIPATELVIGGTWEPDTVITVDVGGVYRLRSKPSAEVCQGSFGTDEALFRYLTNRSNPNSAAWSNA